MRAHTEHQAQVDRENELFAEMTEEVPGEGFVAQKRAEAVMKMYAYLRDNGEADKEELLDQIDHEEVEYASPSSAWANLIKGKETLRELPGVQTPRTGMSTWRFDEQH